MALHPSHHYDVRELTRACRTTIVATFGGLLIAVFVYRLMVAHSHRLRLITTLASSATSNYFAQPQGQILLFMQRHLLLAPLFKRRHNEPLMTVWGKLYLGTLPSRINAILLFVYILMNFLFCTLALPWTGNIGPEFKLEQPTKASLVAEFRGRTGVMAAFNLIPLFVCMMRNNYAGRIAGVSGGFNTWNLYHRWAGRIVAIESFAHMAAWMVNQVDHSGFGGISSAIKASRFLQMGLMVRESSLSCRLAQTELILGQAEVALVLIILFSVAPFRHAHYQVFLGTHQLCVLFFLSGVWFHCYIDQLPHIVYVDIAIGLWVGERLHRLFTLCHRNIRIGQNWSATMAEVTVVPAGEDAVRVSITMEKGWNYQPGQHAYLYIPRLSWTQSHPFSIAWSSAAKVSELEAEQVHAHPADPAASSCKGEADRTPTAGGDVASKCLAHRDLVVSAPKTTIHFVIARRGGFTGRLFSAAAKCNVHKDPEKGYAAPKRFLALVEGPYCNDVHDFDSFASLLFVAGGSGITHPLGYVRHLLAAAAERLVAARRIKLVWIVRDRKNIHWVRDWLDELWRLDAGRGVFAMEIYVTRPAPQSGRLADQSGGPRVKWYAGRPQMDVILAGMLAPPRMRHGRGALAVNGKTPSPHACFWGPPANGV